MCLLHLNNILKFNNTKLIENCSNKNLINIYREMYKRFIIPFYIPSMLLIPLFLILKSKENINFKRFKILIFLFGIVMIIFSETTLRFIDDSNIIFLILTILPFLIFLFLYSIFYYKLNYKK